MPVDPTPDLAGETRIEWFNIWKDGDEPEYEGPAHPTMEAAIAAANDDLALAGEFSDPLAHVRIEKRTTMTTTRVERIALATGGEDV